MNILRYYNQNKKSLWIIATIIFIIIVVIQMANYLVGLDLERNKEKETTIAHSEDEYKVNPDISVEIKEEEVKEEKILVIDQFIRYCNAGKVQEAYNLLSTSCKNNLYPTLDKFIQKYYSSTYKSTKLYSKEKYCMGTFKIKLIEDALSTGKVSGSYVEDYFTIVYENEEPKLNISRFIKEEEPNIVSEGKYLKIEIKKKYIYKECIEYVLDIKNLTDKDIMLDSLTNPKSVYLKNQNNIKFYSSINENPSNDLVLYANLSKQIRVKFNVEYNENNNPDKMVFSNIILDKKLYDSTDKKKEFSKIGNMEINLK